MHDPRHITQQIQKGGNSRLALTLRIDIITRNKRPWKQLQNPRKSGSEFSLLLLSIDYSLSSASSQCKNVFYMWEIYKNQAQPSHYIFLMISLIIFSLPLFFFFFSIFLGYFLAKMLAFCYIIFSPAIFIRKAKTNNSDYQLIMSFMIPLLTFS